MIDQLYAYGRVREVLEQIRKLEAVSPRALGLALRDICTSLENGAIVDFDSALQLQFEFHDANEGPVPGMTGEHIEDTNCQLQRLPKALATQFRLGEKRLCSDKYAVIALVTELR